MSGVKKGKPPALYCYYNPEYGYDLFTVHWDRKKCKKSHDWIVGPNSLRIRSRSEGWRIIKLTHEEKTK